MSNTSADGIENYEAKQDWRPLSWTECSDNDSDHYSDQDISQVRRELAGCPRLVDENEIDQLKAELAKVYSGEKIYFQAGDCVELFQDAGYENYKGRLLFLDSISSYIEGIYGKPVLTIGRMAGQFAKPRSKQTEIVNGVTMNTFMGEMINDYSPNVWSRKAQAARMLWAYQASKIGVDSIRKFREESENATESRTIFTSHEGFNLHYESALTEISESKKSYFNYSSHLQWIGMRSLYEGSKHLEYFKGIDNPIAVKVGPSAEPEFLKKIYKRLNGRNEVGKMVLVTRLGDSQVQAKLPALIQAMQDIDAKVIWVSDPMHGNTVSNNKKVKTRCLSSIKKEVVDTIEIHGRLGSRLSGLHLETSPDKIKECADKAHQIDQITDGSMYKTYCDPRLNYVQTLSVVSSFINKARKVGE